MFDGLLRWQAWMRFSLPIFFLGLMATLVAGSCSASEQPSDVPLGSAARAIELKRIDYDAPLYFLPTTGKARASQLRLLWISLDGLKKRRVLDFLSRHPESHPQGLRAFVGAGKIWQTIEVANPTITSSSHASTLTCAPPGVHGIFANSQWNGEGMESGFDKVYSTETFVHALRHAGLKVGVLGYPGMDGRSPNRTADFAMAYDSSGLRSQLIALPVAQGSSKEMLEGRLAIPSRLSSAGAPVSPFELEYRYSAAKQTLQIVHGDEVKATLQPGQWWEVLMQDSGRRQLVTLSLLVREGKARQGVDLYVSAPSLNQIVPQSMLEEMESKGLIFSPGKDYRVLSEVGVPAFLETMRHRTRYFEETAHYLLNQELDAAFFYFEDFDVLGHQFEGAEGAQSFWDTHLQRFDRRLGRLLERVSETTHVVVVGDHGMSPVQYELNPMALLSPSARENLVVRSSGGALFLYGKESGSLKSPPPANEKWFRKLVESLQNQELPSRPGEGKKLFQRVVVRGSPEAAAEGWSEATELPWIAAFAHPDVGLKVHTDDGLLVSLRNNASLPDTLLKQAIGGDAQLLGEPVPLGQHGHDSASEEMQTSAVLWGPRFSSGTGVTASVPVPETMKNIDLVPWVADRLGLPRPQACAQSSAK